MTNNMRQLIDLVEGTMSPYKEVNKTPQRKQHINSTNTLTVDVNPYELTRLMADFRSQVDGYGKIKDSANVSFYTMEEKDSFEQFLRSKNISFNDISNNDEESR